MNKALKTTKIIQNLSIGYSAPSNIALVKYWGKFPVQIPANPSISFTLQNCKTETYVDIRKSEKKLDDFSIKVLVENHRKKNFEPKIYNFFKRIQPYFLFLKDYHFTIRTINTFPHSSGIASSASGFAALSACLVKLELLLSQNEDIELNTSKASFIARLGSGSASRSIVGPMMVWGDHDSIKGSKQETAVVFDDIHDIYKTYQDVILLVDKGQKKVSSSVGHQLMQNHPFALSRFQQANEHLSQLIPAIQTGDIDKFISITESEALSLHAMMMSSKPYYILMKPQTISVIDKIWQYRSDKQIPVSFTLDAGANVHVLFPKKYKNTVLDFIHKELVVFCQNEQYICDNVGIGIIPLL